MRVLTLAAMLVGLASARGGLRGLFPQKYPTMLNNGVDPGEPLFLTPYIQKGQFDQGKLCAVCCETLTIYM